MDKFISYKDSKTDKIIKIIFVIFILSFFFLVGISITGFFIFDYSQNYKCKDCNIILISIDTLRADHLGVYGYYRDTTPNIDKFSEESIVFKNAFSQAPSTLPSHATMLTSLYPVTHKAELGDNPTPLDDKYLTLAEILKDNEYKTIAFVEGGQISKEFNIDQGFDDYIEAVEDGFTCSFSNKTFIKFGCMKENILKTVEWISKNKNEKFFIFYHTYATHHPYVVLDEGYQKFTDKENITYIDEQDNTITLDPRLASYLISPFLNNEVEINDKIKETIIGNYDDTIYFMDDWIGYLLKEINSMGLDDNTIIIFTSDHGEEFDEHGFFGIHGHSLYDELLHVPLIIKNPKINHKIIDRQVRLIDIMPTTLDVLDIKIKDKFSGVSLISYIYDSKENLPIFSSMEFKGADTSHKISLRKDNFKLIYDLKNDHIELIDLSKDNEEKINIAESDKKTAEELKKELLRLYEENKNYKTKTDTISRDTLTKLKSLGYLG